MLQQMKYSIPKVPNMNDTINLMESVHEILVVLLISNMLKNVCNLMYMYMNIVGKYLLISID